MTLPLSRRAARSVLCETSSGSPNAGAAVAQPMEPAVSAVARPPPARRPHLGAEQQRGALHIGEQQRHRARRQRGHPPITPRRSSPALDAPNGALRSPTAFECRNPTAHVLASQQTPGQDLLRADPPPTDRSGHAPPNRRRQSDRVMDSPGPQVSARGENAETGISCTNRRKYWGEPWVSCWLTGLSTRAVLPSGGHPSGLLRGSHSGSERETVTLALPPGVSEVVVEAQHR
jgi:hypothetical protein